MFGFGKSKEPVKEWKVKDNEPKVTKTFGRPSSSLTHEPSFEKMEKDNHLAAYNAVLKYFKEKELYPVKEGDCPEADWKPLNNYEKAWLSKECILRYLRACNWIEKDCIKRITSSIAWRREFGIAGGEFEIVTSDLVKEENETGKQLVFGYDDEKRPCLFLMNGRQNTKASDRQIQHLIYMIEKSIDYMPQGQDKLCLCVDFKKYPESCPYESKVPAVGLGKQILYILQYHYPERLGRAMFINMPVLANIFLKLCWPFVDPYTKQKCKFNEPFGDHIQNDQLAYNFGGDINYEYIHNEYWDDFVAKANIKRDVILANFEKHGADIGLSEWELREGL
ncbi:hypothetical protein DAMA08_024670 [Martiniozyma asiatica (nom. inval.)]|nr:hypothetical protein DAMA08_024670 [Martiniozyma asiatica]